MLYLLLKISLEEIHMNLYPWYVFYILAEEKSFIKAARRLHISQSAVSHAIAKLEDSCGCGLFIRNRNNVELSSSGEQLLPEVRQLLRCSDFLNQSVENLKNAKKGKIQVAAFHSAASMWLPSIIQNFKEKYPDTDVFLHQTGDGKIRTMIEKKEVDLAFTTLDAIGNISGFLPLHKTPLKWMTSLEYCPKNGRSITIEDLQQTPLIFPQEGYDTEMSLYLRQLGITLEPQYRIEDDFTIFEYIERGMGISLMPYMTALCCQKQIRTWDLDLPMMRIVGLVNVYGELISPAAEQFRQEIIYYMTKCQLLNI